MIRLYKHVKSLIYYWEVWEDNCKIVFHRGIVGEIGQTNEIDIYPPASHKQIIEKEAEEYRNKGFEEIPSEKYRSIIIQRHMNLFNSINDFEWIQEIQEILDQSLGWTGNGYCDGHDIGSGTINIFLLVVDPFQARRTIIETLDENNFLNDTSVALETEEGFEVFWSQDSLEFSL